MKILVADDDGICRRLAGAALREGGHRVVLSEDGCQAWDALRDGDFDVAILDWMMPRMDGVEICRRMLARASDIPVYTILLTSRGEHDDVVAGLDAGADEYLVKPFNAEELRARVRVGGRIVDLQRKLLRANERLEVLASTDELTGLMNRRAITARLEEEIIRSRREGRPLSAMMMDIDRFKRINDEHGHAAGDAALREFSRRVGACVRRYDALGRLGGDEFFLLMPGTNQEQAVSMGERVRAAVAEGEFRTARDVSLRATASIGVTELGATDDGWRMIMLADQAMYEAKSRGGNQVRADETARRSASTVGGA